MSDDTRADAHLLESGARGDAAAFAVLVRRYIRSATLLAAQLVGDSDDAEDIVQEAFTIVLRKSRDFDNTRPFGPWFFAIIRRLSAHKRARDARRARLLRLWGRSSVNQEFVAAVDGLVLAQIDIEVATRALNELSPMQRACFELVAIRDISTDEVAAMHGISESTVRQHVFRARAVLRLALDDGKPATEVRGSH